MLDEGRRRKDGLVAGGGDGGGDGGERCFDEVFVIDMVGEEEVAEEGGGRARWRSGRVGQRVSR